jgi:oligoendopeptidase F
MFHFRPRSLFLVAAALLMVSAAARAAERSEIPEKYKWNLRDLFATEADWKKAKDGLAADIPNLTKYQGRLGESATVFLECLSTYMRMNQALERVYTYSSQTFDQDTRVNRSQEMEQEIEEVFSKYRTASSFLRPEIISLGKAKIDAYLTAEPKLAEYRIYLDGIVRWAPHTLSTEQEKLLARASRLAGTPDNVYSIFTSAEMPYPTVTLSTGEEVRLDPAAYTKYRTVANRDDRLKVFRAFFQVHQDYRRTLGTTLGAHMQSHVMNRDLRGFKSCLEGALFDDNIPETVYHQLVTDVNANLPTLHRYLELRKRMMGLEDLGYEDLYAPIVKEVDMTFTPEEGLAVVLEAVKPLGQDYGTVLGNGLLKQGWTDWIPSTGKRAGAYSTGAYGVHPYQLLNYYDGYDDVSTLAHESGHSLHTYLSAKTQPYVNYEYATFVAEVASTLNENLLFHDMVDKAKDDDTRLFLLGNYLEGLRTTLFRQTMFAEFELAIHEMAERGEAITGDGLNGLYLGLVRKYCGHDKGVCRVDDLYGAEWTYIHHFYYNFYVYQYATSLIASTALANGIRDESGSGSTAHRDAYLRLLSSGSSKYPVDLLKDAGVDMTTSAPFQACMREMNAVMDEMEKILTKR